MENFKKWVNRYPAIGLLIALVLSFLNKPFSEELPHGPWVGVILFTLILLLAALTLWGRRTMWLTTLVLIVPALALRWVSHLYPDSIPSALDELATIAFFLFIAGSLLLFVLRAQQVDGNVLCAGLSGYMMLGMLWIPAYILVDRIQPGSFLFSADPANGIMTGFNAFYFSFVTLCTVGFGDIVPVGRVARMLVVVEAIAGLFYMAVIMARLVALYSTPKEKGTA